LYKTTITFSFI